MLIIAILAMALGSIIAYYAVKKGGDAPEVASWPASILLFGGFLAAWDSYFKFRESLHLRNTKGEGWQLTCITCGYRCRDVCSAFRPKDEFICTLCRNRRSERKPET